MDNSVSINCVAAWLGWFAAVTMVVGSLALGWSDGVGRLGLVLSAAAATLHIRQMIHRLEDRERNAYELGRDSAFSSLLDR